MLRRKCHGSGLICGYADASGRETDFHFPTWVVRRLAPDSQRIQKRGAGSQLDSRGDEFATRSPGLPWKNFLDPRKTRFHGVIVRLASAVFNSQVSEPGSGRGRVLVPLLLRNEAQPRQDARSLSSLRMTFRRATLDDCALLAELNHQLVRDEGHRNRMSVPELEQRMHGWLLSEYAAAVFENGGEVVAYALYRDQPEEIYLRQLFVVRNQRRQGVGRQAFEILRSQIWPTNKRLTVDVLVKNTAAVAFWRAVGYKDYCLTLEIMPKGLS